MHGKTADVDGIRVQRRAHIVGAGGAVTSEIVFSSMHFSSGVLERACRAVVGKASVDLGLVLGWWHADHRQDVDEQIWNPRRRVTPR